MGAQHTGGEVRPGHAGHPGPLYQPPAPDDPAMVGGHRIAARLGVGALGPVYLAYAPDGRPVALTAVRPELAARSGFAAAFEHDVQAVRRVHGPYTVPVLGSGHDGSRYWLAAGYVPALTLHAAVTDAGRPLPVPVVLRLVAGVAEALRAVHHAGVVHAGLGPGTVLLAADGPRVTGYGVTRAGADAPGIPAFSSPEQAADKPPVPATDVFALGQLAAYAAIGAPPFGARALHEEPDLSELPGELREIVTRCLIKDPALRPSPSQVIAMCTQATHHRAPTPWLPTPLQTLLTLPPPLPPLPPPGTWPRPPAAAAPPSMPPAAPIPPAVPGAPPPGATPVPPPLSGTAVPAASPAGTTPPGGTALPQPVPGVTPLAGTPVPGATPPGGTPVPGATPPGGVPLPPPPSGPAAPHASGPVPGAAPADMPVPVAPPAGATPPGGTAVFPAVPGATPLPPPPGGPLAPHAGRSVRGAPAGESYRTPPRGVVVGVGSARRRGRFVVGGWVAAAVVVLGAAAFGAGLGRGDSVAARPDAGAPQATRPDTGSPPTGQPGAGAAPTGTPGRTTPGTREYYAIGLDAGQALALEDDPSNPRPGAANGTLGYTPDGQFFVTDAARGAMALLDPDVPGTLEACRSEDNLVVSLPRTQLAVGSRLCVVATDGTTALVTFRQLSAPGGPAAHAALDITVWPARQL